MGWRGTAPGSCSTARPSTLGSTTTRTTPGCSLHQHQQQQQPGGGNNSPTVSYSSRSRLKCDRCCSCSFHIYINSLLPVSRYIDTAFADKGSHQKKDLQPKCLDTSKFGLLGKPTKKLGLNQLF